MERVDYIALQLTRGYDARKKNRKNHKILIITVLLVIIGILIPIVFSYPLWSMEHIAPAPILQERM